jgi:hypothetical protein
VPCDQIKESASPTQQRTKNSLQSNHGNPSATESIENY